MRDNPDNNPDNTAQKRKAFFLLALALLDKLL